MRLLYFLAIQFLYFIWRNVELYTIGQTTEASLTAEVDAFYDKTLLKPIRSAWIWGKYGQARPVQKNDTIRFSIYPILGTNPVALVEGVNPEPQLLTKSSITATVSLYGGYIELTEECDVYREDPIVAIAQERASWQAVETCDEIIRDVVYGGTNVMYAGAVSAATGVVTKITATDLRKLARAMRQNNTPFLKDMITGGTGVGTAPISNAWLMFVSPEVVYDLETSVTGWKPVTEYSAQKDVEPNEEGAFGNFRMLSSTNAPKYGGSGYTHAVGSTGLAQTEATGYIDNHQCLAIGPDAYGVVEIDGGIKTIRKDKSQIGGPLELYGTAGWKARMTAKILQDDLMYRYECGVTA